MIVLNEKLQNIISQTLDEFHIVIEQLWNDISTNNGNNINRLLEEHENNLNGKWMKNRSRYNKTTLSTIFDHNEEKWYIVVCQVFIPFMIAGFGMVVTRLVFERVMGLNVFKEITEIYILVPALLGLKENLEMRLASRLSIQANIGNIALTQLQAIVVDFLVALVSLAMR
ncbi:unnamed protein product [Adineta steineri]|uniref:Uncharacterized protein n=1 Tax=Adineta steineri TaxID=433720 RepID=A0A813MJ44_9BILA|nr:unnamed protein product [Adineta steineri]CAF0753840.1 unnamed protein product [Adineta steineri]CAF0833927.1 unnamed protein product [Adineta steineri]